MKQNEYAQRLGTSRSKALGITQRATTSNLSWIGDIRARFSDFQVNEIRPDGTVIHLQQIGTGNETASILEPKQAEQASKPKAEEEPAPAPAPAPAPEPKEKPVESLPEISEEDVAKLKELVGEAFATELLSIYSTQPEDAAQKTRITSEPVEDKYKRGQIHQEIRRIFNSSIETNTDDAGAILAQRCKVGRGKKRGRGGREQKRDKPAAGKPAEKPAGEYLHFTLYKDNRDTIDAVNQIARFLKVRPQVINYAGIKDRRASSAQRCCVRFIRSEQALAGINGRLWGVVTGDYLWSDDRVYLGQLLGNEFTITAKDCQIYGELNSAPLATKITKLQENIDASLKSMYANGWINYFGHQRFGTHDIGTHEVGKLIIGENYEAAVRSLLVYDPDMPEELPEEENSGEERAYKEKYARNQACKLFWESEEGDKAARMMPMRYTAEASMLRHLSKKGARRDYTGAILSITRGLRTIYLHAYQSHVWNHAASKRWELHGATVVPGDLVIAEAETAPVETDQDGEDVINPSADDDFDTPVRARPLTEEDVTAGTYTIHDVVLPTPGYEVVYPANDIGRFYESFMSETANGALDPHQMRRVRREFSLPGRYRKLMNRFLAPPSAEVRAYADETEQMHPTDLDLIKAAHAPGAGSEEEGRSSKRQKQDEEDVAMGDGENHEEEEKQPENVAVVIKFQLGKSAYATVALRELMGDPPEDA